MSEEKKKALKGLVILLVFIIGSVMSLTYFNARLDASFRYQNSPAGLAEIKLQQMEACVQAKKEGLLLDGCGAETQPQQNNKNFVIYKPIPGTPN